ncbi:MAG: ATP-binding protein [Spirosomataceae bacterium]
MKYYVSILLLLCFSADFCIGQDLQKIDSLKLALSYATSDTMRVLIYEKLMTTEPERQKKIEYGLLGFELAKKNRYAKGTLLCGNQVAWALSQEEYYRAIPIFMETKQVAELTNDKEALAFALRGLGYSFSKYDKPKGLSYYYRCKNLMEKEGFSEDKLVISLLIGMWHKENKKYLDSALFYLNKSYQLALKSPTYSYKPNEHLRYFGQVYYQKGQYKIALDYFKQAIANHSGENQFSYRYIALIFRDQNQLDSSKFYAQQSLEAQTILKPSADLIQTTTLLCELYKNDNPAKALQYLLLANATKDSLFNQDKIRQANKLNLEEQEREASIKRRIEAHQTDFENKIKIYALLAILLGLSILAFLLYRNNKNKQQANYLLHRQKQEIDLQRDKAEKALSELKATQSQLIQSEKLASLGELTAGIAHEIQNPLNFVNNFSEVSRELLEEVLEERKKEKGVRDEELIDELLSDLSQNQTKINHHGKRASSIVKGMLEHSRTNTGEKVLTDLNTLVDEYLRLSYHGMRAKDKTFNADYEFIADPNLPLINVVPQEIGRVLLNLINNAFQSPLSYKEGTPPTKKVTVRTFYIKPNDKDHKGSVMAHISDNGAGISTDILPKIFQPFFTTKPTGEGTGLGLSLSYDIVTKGHRGSLEVESVEGEHTTFIIKLPI